MTPPIQQAKCEECGTPITIGVNGVSGDHDLCDRCANVTRNGAGQIIDETWFNMSDDELVERLR